MSSEPGQSAEAITPHDVTPLSVTRGIYVGGNGNVRVLMHTGGDVTFSNAVAGTILPISVVRVFATGTTATNLIALR